MLSLCDTCNDGATMLMCSAKSRILGETAGVVLRLPTHQHTYSYTQYAPMACIM